ncbi:MAG: THUMP domain-containing class I SAM-dependent RNA methyltransferase [Kiritimatiellia bacterium]
MKSQVTEDIWEFHAATIPGTEGVLCDELRELGFASVRLNRGGIPFRGTMQEGWRACLQSRIAARIQVVLGRFPCRTPDDLYHGVQAIDWRPFITRSQTLAVSAVSREAALSHSGFTALKVKDAIVDQLREDIGARPDVDREDADVRVFAHVANQKAAVYLDLAGEPLNKRGYRKVAGEAPLRETIAAAVLRMAGWDRETPFTDPMCGSGTLAIEAALWAGNFAPGLLREKFGFERWANFDEDAAVALRLLRGQLRSETKGTMPRIVASDRDAGMVDMARQNARAAGVKLAFRVHDVLETPPAGEHGFIVTNPPYGQRLEMDRAFPRQVAAVFSRLHGWRIGIMTGSPAYQQAISAKPLQAIQIPNGGLDCTFLVYDMP